MLWNAMQQYIDSKDGGFMSIQYLKERLLEMPQRGVAEFADVPKGGGFEYSGPIIPIDHFPRYAAKLVALAQRYNLLYSGAARLISGGHSMMFAISFAFNRDDKGMMERVKQALDEATQFALEQGGIPWKPNFLEQRMILERMDPNTRDIFKTIKETLDPKHIMNPGNWEIS